MPIGARSLLCWDRYACAHIRAARKELRLMERCEQRDDEMFWSECDDCRAARRYVAGDLATVVLAALGVLALASLILTFCS